MNSHCIEIVFGKRCGECTGLVLSIAETMNFPGLILFGFMYFASDTFHYPFLHYLK